MAEVEWIEDIGAFAAVADEWDAVLLRSGVDDPFLASDFVLAWWRHFGAGRELRVALVRAAGVPWGGLPLYAERVRGRTWLRFVGAEDFALANRTDVMTPAGSDGVVETIARELAERDDWDVLELARVHLPPAEVDALVEVFVRRGHLLRHAQEFPRFLIDVPADPEAYLAAASKNFRKKLARARRAAEEVGALELVEREGADEVRAAFARYVAFSRAAFRARGGASSFEDARLVAFFEDLLPRFDERGWLHAHELQLAGTPIAIGFGYSLRGALNDVLSTFDVERAELSPGNLMTWQQLALASRRGLTQIDLATGENPHKLRWATRTEPVAGLVFERDTPARRLVHGARRAARAVLRPRG